MKFLETLKKYQSQILLVLFVLLFFRSCGDGSELKKLRKEVEFQREILNNLPTKVDLQIERQTEIEDLIRQLEESKK
jgi:hypothetical protein